MIMTASTLRRTSPKSTSALEWNKRELSVATYASTDTENGLETMFPKVEICVGVQSLRLQNADLACQPAEARHLNGQLRQQRSQEQQQQEQQLLGLQDAAAALLAEAGALMAAAGCTEAAEISLREQLCSVKAAVTQQSHQVTHLRVLGHCVTLIYIHKTLFAVNSPWGH